MNSLARWWSTRRVAARRRVGLCTLGVALLPVVAALCPEPHAVAVTQHLGAECARPHACEAWREHQVVGALREVARAQRTHWLRGRGPFDARGRYGYARKLPDLWWYMHGPLADRGTLHGYRIEVGDPAHLGACWATAADAEGLCYVATARPLDDDGSAPSFAVTHDGHVLCSPSSADLAPHRALTLDVKLAPPSVAGSF